MNGKGVARPQQPKPSPPRVDLDIAPHFSEMPVFKAYAKRIEAIVTKAGSSGVTTADIHRKLGRGLQHMTLDALAYIGANARTVSPCRYVIGYQHKPSRVKHDWQQSNTTMYKRSDNCGAYPTAHLENAI